MQPTNKGDIYDRSNGSYIFMQRVEQKVRVSSKYVLAAGNGKRWVYKTAAADHVASGRWQDDAAQLILVAYAHIRTYKDVYVCL